MTEYSKFKELNTQRLITAAAIFCIHRSLN